MNSSPRPSGGVIAAGTAAILCGAIGALCGVAILTLMSSSQLSPAGPALPPALRPVVTGVWAVSLVCALFVAVAGVQLIRLRNWARVSLLVVAGCMLFFGLIGIGVIIFSVFIAAPPDPLISRALLATVLAIFYGVPILVGAWWMFVLTRSSIVAQFQPQTTLDAADGNKRASWLNSPECPLAVRIIGWYLGSFILFLPIVPFFSNRVPFFFFGALLQGPAATALFAIYFAFIAIPALGLLSLKKWSYPLTIASQLFAIANSAVSMLSLTYVQRVHEMLEQLNLPDFTGAADQLLRYSRFFSLFLLLLPVAIIVTLLVCRQKFFAACDRAANRRANQPPLPQI